MNEPSTVTVGQLDPFHLHIVRSCFAATIDQLSAIRNDYESPECPPPTADTIPAPLERRFAADVYRSDGIFLRTTGEPFAQGVDRLLFDQLRADKHFVMQTLRDAKRELRVSGGHYDGMTETTNALLEQRRDEAEFVGEYARNVLLLRRLRRYVAVLQKRNELAGTVQSPPLFDEAHMTNALRLRFARNWEQARQAQQTQRCRTIELDFRRQLAQTQQLIDYETRCKEEMDQFMTTKIESMSQDCVTWMERFDADYEAVDVDIQVAIEQLDEMQKKRAETAATFGRRTGMIEDYYRKIREREEFNLRYKMYEKNALIIQIWWREYMVRYGLGPYKLPKLKKPKAKK